MVIGYVTVVALRVDCRKAFVFGSAPVVWVALLWICVLSGSVGFAFSWNGSLLSGLGPFACVGLET